MTSSTGASVGGGVRRGFEAVAEAFEVDLAGHELGAAFAAYADGELVVDLYGGDADRHGRRWDRETLVGIYSGSKGLVATCLLVLVERGDLDLEEPVVRYWPEFGAAGKEGILVRHLVSHQAGLPGLLTPVSAKEATNSRRMADLLARQAPLKLPDGGPLYHAITFGWLCGELVRRTVGRSIGAFLAEEVAGPLDLDLWIGLPAAEEPRVATLEASPAFVRDMAALSASREDNLTAWSIWSNPPRFEGGELAANRRFWRAAEIAASNAVASPRSVAKLYGALAAGGALGGERLVRPDSVELARTPLASGVDPNLGGSLAFGLGFELQTEEMGLGPAADAFGHAGSGGSLHGAWPSLGVGFSFAPNLLGKSDGETGEARAAPLLRALHAARVA